MYHKDLYASSCGCNERLDGRRVVTPGKFLLLRLLALDDRNCQEILVDFFVQINDVIHLRREQVIYLHCQR